ncbi:uncharacterized protein LOC114526263 isoform X2 [Dendronephthya gigantea]|uniref:uncharacterized protein LOC114526263 isoform X2 n=2 Tax=Dendronephthya gigantea TaxID=151771 RepID=UPI00106954AA|nr:uncharacterized protein LOC114526263 isoform X2 [Dendronephthya gigantea]
MDVLTSSFRQFGPALIVMILRTNDSSNSTNISLWETTPSIRTTNSMPVKDQKYYTLFLYITNNSPREATVFINSTGSGVFNHVLHVKPRPYGFRYLDVKFLYPVTFDVFAKDSKNEEVLTLNEKQRLSIRARKLNYKIPFRIEIKTSPSVKTEATNNETSGSIATTVISMKTNPTNRQTTNTSFVISMKTNPTNRQTTNTSFEQINIFSTKTPPAESGNANNKDDGHKLMFHISVGVGSVFATLLFSLIIILTRRSLRKRSANRKRVDYWTKINRACQSQYIPNEEVSSNNPMYEGSRSRTTSNVLYAASEQENITSIASGKNDYVLNPSTQQSTKPDLVISNSCPLYQNADDLYSEPRKNHRVEEGNYERIRSFIHDGNGEVKESTCSGSYAEPSVIFNGLHITENTGYVSAKYQSN